MTLSKIITVGALMLSTSITTACAANNGEVSALEKNQLNRYQKPGASISYSHNLRSELSAGQTASFKLTLSEVYRAGNLTVNLSPDGDLRLFPTSTQANFDMGEEGPHEMDISFTANSNGRFYINVEAVAVNSTGQSRPRIFSIPVQVGPAIAQKPNVDMKMMESGRNVIEMDAQEEIK